jgi:RNA:NAD 2'-phosphotransferase (TPT1/KptA family)
MGSRNVQLSKFLSFVLRHQPDTIGLALDVQGWAVIDELIAKSDAAGTRLTRDELLQPQSRQQVHLSADEATAHLVGQRHGKPVVLTVDALRMHAAGFKFYRADNGVWLTDQVPREFLVAR